MPSRTAEGGDTRLGGVEHECGRAEESIGGGMREEGCEVCGRRVDGVRNVVVIVGEERELEGPGVGDEGCDDQDRGREYWQKGIKVCGRIRCALCALGRPGGLPHLTQIRLRHSSGWLPAG